jgi:hypothetical protein
MLKRGYAKCYCEAPGNDAANAALGAVKPAAAASKAGTKSHRAKC